MRKSKYKIRQTTTEGDYYIITLKTLARLVNINNDIAYYVMFSSVPESKNGHIRIKKHLYKNKS